MGDFSAGKSSLGIEDSANAGTYIAIGPLRDPLPAVVVERAVLDNTNGDVDTEQTRAGMKKISPMAFKIELNNDNPAVALLSAALADGEDRKWEYKYASKGAQQTAVFTAWVSKIEEMPALKDGTFLTITLNPNSKD